MEVFHGNSLGYCLSASGVCIVRWEPQSVGHGRCSIGPAEAADVDFTIGAERKVEAETNAMYLDSHVELFAGIGATSGVNYDVDSDGDASFNSFELDFNKSIGGATLYVNNDFDVNLDHTESVVGFKYKF